MHRRGCLLASTGFERQRAQGRRTRSTASSVTGLAPPWMTWTHRQLAGAAARAPHQRAWTRWRTACCSPAWWPQACRCCGGCAAGTRIGWPYVSPRAPSPGGAQQACMPACGMLAPHCLYAWPLWANALAAVAGRPCTRARRSCRHVGRGDTVCRGRCRCAAHLAREELRTSRAGLWECWHGVLERLAGRMLAGPGAGRQ